MAQPPMQRFNDPDSALESLAQRLGSVPTDRSVQPVAGHILASPIVADRDSPAADVSAMDGYAVRMSDLTRNEPITVSGECVPGSPPVEMVKDAVVRVFTGAIVPSGFDAVIKREDTEEQEASVRLLDSARSIEPGMHIRRAGENARAGSVVLSPGIPITGAARATMANFGCRKVDLFQRVRVTLVTTGDEVGEFTEEAPKPWQLRNSNRASITTMLQQVPWTQIVHVDHCRDDRDALMQLLRSRVQESDAILLTGGVSMGDYDYVPDVLREIGGEVVFHGLPVRPGKPILGAATSEGKLLMGLPGNPVSATVGCRRMAIPLLAKLGGLSQWMPTGAMVRLTDPDATQSPLWWFRHVRIVDSGIAEVVESLGSGDLVSLGTSCGFVELPPNGSGEGPWPYTPWA